jgi:uncharacterized protein
VGAVSLRIGVADLLGHPGERRPVLREVAAAEMGDLVISTAHVPGDSVVTVDVVLESILPPSIVTAGQVRFEWVGECRRCLRDVRGAGSADVREIFEHQPTEGETYPLHHESVDLSPLVRDAVLLTLPLAPLCSTECAGPAPDVAAVLPADAAETAAGAADSTDRPVDPRWAGLDELRFD